MVLEKTLESPLDCTEHKPVKPKGNQSFSLKGLMLKVKLQYFGHLIRRAYLLEKGMLGKIEGKRRREWQRMRWLDSITDSIDMNLSKLREVVEDGRAWRATIHEVAESRTRLSNLTTVSLFNFRMYLGAK